MPAVAVTDQANLFAMVKFYKAAQAAGIKPIVGVDLLIRELGQRAEPSRLTLLVMDEIGYGNLTRLVTKSFLEGQRRDRTPMTRSSASGSCRRPYGRTHCALGCRRR
jgi:DNA polymerase-3 subunit alpha